jgi:hypothetical protein
LFCHVYVASVTCQIEIEFFLFLGAIEVTIANMYKAERSKVEEVYVVGFVPSYLLPKKRPCLLDPFLDLLVTEIEDIFIHGIIVKRNYVLCELLTLNCACISCNVYTVTVVTVLIKNSNKLFIF